MPDPHVDIRRATAGDASRLARLAAATFRAAFEEDNRPADMDAYVREAFSEERTRAELADPRNHFFLAATREAPELIGYAKLRDAEPEPCVTGPRPIEIERIYVGQQALGTGVGPALMETCLDEARGRGYRTVWLGVWEGNLRALAFYRRWGFRRVGTHTFQLGSDPQTDLVLELALDSTE